MQTPNSLKSFWINFFSITLAMTGILGYDSISHNEFSYPNLNQLISQKSGNPGQIWERVRKNYSFPKAFLAQHVDKHRIQQFVKQYTETEHYWNTMGIKASPYLYYIIEQLEARNMPGELALLPMLESAFEPQATSNKGAAGLWQFIPGTGRFFGLQQDSWYDGRRDIMASTQAALDYLSSLHKQFNNNWMLALAAYNAGETRVQKAIDKNKKAGKSIHFNSLPLPKETKDYVPKLLALAELIQHPEKHSISLPNIENKPYFVDIEPGKSLDFNKIAKLAGIKMRDLKRLNPGYRRESTHPAGPQQLLLPIANAINLLNNLHGSKLR